MRICLMLASWGLGGLEKHVVELSNGLSSRHEVHVMVHASMAGEFADGVIAHPFDWSRSRWSPFLLCDAVRVIRSINPDVVHAHANKAVKVASLIRPFVAEGKMVGTIHNQKSNTSAFSSMDHVIGVSPGVARAVHRTEVSAIYNGINPPSPSPVSREELIEEYGLDASRPVLVSAGRLVPAKGFDVLIKAAAKADAQVIIFGDGHLHDELSGLIQETSASVVLAGYKSDVNSVISASDGYVMSSHREGFSYSIVEALFSELPIISTRIPMVEGVIPESLIVDPGNVDALASKIENSISNMESWRASMMPAFQFAKSNLTLDAMVRKTEMVYSKVATC